MCSAALLISRDARASRQLEELIHAISVVTWLRNLLLVLLLLIKVALLCYFRYGILRVSVAMNAQLAPVDVRLLIADRTWTVISLIRNQRPLG